MRSSGPPRSPRLTVAVGILFFVLVVVLPSLTSRIADWLWFREIGFERVFFTKIAAQWIIGLLSGAIAFAVLYGNARYALRGLVVGPARVRNTLHPLGRAVDLRTNDLPADVPPQLAAALGQALGTAFHVVLEPDHIHVEFNEPTIVRM